MFVSEDIKRRTRRLQLKVIQAASGKKSLLSFLLVAVKTRGESPVTSLF